MFYDTNRMAQLQIGALYREAALERSIRRGEPVAPISKSPVGRVMPRAGDARRADVPVAVALSLEPPFPAAITSAVAADCRDDQAA